MGTVTKIIGIPLFYLIVGCYNIFHNYALSVVSFTLLTKVILFPVSLWTHRNSLKMVSIMPELNELKVKYYGDKDTIAEETQQIYKRVGYHPLLSTVPMIIQIVLLMGVVGAIRELLGDSNSVLTLYPSEARGLTLLVPLLAGFAALSLGLAQNHINALQREQSKAEQWMTNGLSIVISLALGAFVPMGVGIYWIFSNLFTILNQLALNAAVPPAKHIDYPALRTSQEKLKAIEALSPKVSKEDKQREKADYKRFFSVANKHLVFYSESSGFYKYFKNVIEYLLSHSNVTIHYVTSDPQDQIFERAKNRPQIRPYYIGENKLITLFMKMDADIVVMTMPDLENYHLKRSYVRKDIEYIYMFHGVISSMRTIRQGALDHYDTIFTIGDYQEKEIRLLDEIHGLPQKKLVPCGYGLIEDLAAAYENMEKKSNSRFQVLIAPSYQEDNILESCLEPLVRSLLNKGWDVIVRPHPQYLKRFPAKFEAIAQSCENQFPKDHFRIEKSFISNETVFTADLLVTDWSGIGYEYALATQKPVLFINTPMKVINPECVELGREEFEFDLRVRKIMGIALLPEEVGEKAGQAASELLSSPGRYAAQIEQIRREHIYHFGESGKFEGQYILHQLTKSKHS